MFKIVPKTFCLFSLILFSGVNADISPKQAQMLLWCLSPGLIKKSERDFKLKAIFFGTFCVIGALKTAYETTKFSKKVFQKNRESNVSVQKSLGRASIAAIPPFFVVTCLAYIAKESFVCASQGLYTELPWWMKE